jgi:hypothetical protein
VVTAIGPLGDRRNAAICNLGEEGIDPVNLVLQGSLVRYSASPLFMGGGASFFVCRIICNFEEL